ncbi:MAG: hypothetical protein IID61_18165, partial [SAR324 cluster bacterium]|nr:hypothetical protein [SAR324 cluster bacterium]
GPGLPTGTEVTIVATGRAQTTSSITVLLDEFGVGSGDVTIPSGISLITIYVSLRVVAAAASLPLFDGEEIVAARLEATPGRNSQYVFYTESGQRVPVGFIPHPERHVALPYGTAGG